MSTRLAWGGPVNTTSMFTDDLPFIYCEGMGMDAAPLAANGLRPIRVESIALDSISGGVTQILYRGVTTSGPYVFPDSGGTFRAIAARTGGQLRVGRNNASGGSTFWSDGDSLPGLMPGALYWSGSPSAPRTLALTRTGTTVTATWAAPASDGGAAVTGYLVQISKVANFASIVASATVTSASKAFTGLSANTLYYVRVAANNLVTTGAGTTSPWSASASVTTLALPSAARTLAAAQASITSMNLTWVAPASNGGSAVTGYRIQYATNAAFTSPTTLDVGNVLARTLTGLLPGTAYWVRVAPLTAVTTETSTVNAWSNTATCTLIAEIGNLDGWASFGALPSGLTYLVSGGLRRGAIAGVAGKTGLIREVRQTGSGGPVGLGVLGIRRTVTTVPGKTYRLDGMVIALASPVPSGNRYAFAVTGMTNAGGVDAGAAGAAIPSLTFVATANTHQIQIQLRDPDAWSGTGWWENAGFYDIKLYEIPNISPYRLQDTAYEGPLSNHFTYACDTIGAAWWVDRVNVTRFRQTDSEDTVVATFSDRRDPDHREFVDVSASYDTRNLVNSLSINNHGRNASTGATDDVTTAHQDAASASAWGARVAQMDITMRRTSVFDGTNLVRNPRAGVNTTDYSGSAGGTTPTLSRAATNGPVAVVVPSYVSAAVSAPATYIDIRSNGAAGANQVVTPGKTYNVSGWMSTSLLGTATNVYAQWFTSAGVLLSTSTIALPPIATPGWQFVSGTVVAPATAAYATLIYRNTAAYPSGGYIALSGIQMTEGADLLNYIDGAIATSQDYSYSWSGTAHASTSTRARTLTSVRAGEVFAANGTPVQRISSIRWNAQEDPVLAASLDVQDRILVERGGLSQYSRIVGLKHTITGTRWMVDLELTPSN